jgi:hypothetical protein
VGTEVCNLVTLDLSASSQYAKVEAESPTYVSWLTGRQLQENTNSSIIFGGGGGGVLRPNNIK